MGDRDPSPASSSSTGTNQCRRLRRHVVVEEDHDTVACTGKSCQSCTAGVIADCVAVCCCPCAVVDILALAFFKLPWAVARKCIRGRRKKKSKNRKSIMSSSSTTTKWAGEDADGISEKGRGENGKSCGGESVLSSSPGTHGIGGEEEEVNDDFSAEEVWLELYDEVGHLGFGRVSFTGIPFQNKGN